jgi:hypothetical protein
MISIARHQHNQGSIPFAATALSLGVIAALLASIAPIAFSIATVFLFAGPHNWIELRYFLSRLPARFAKMRSFFLVSFGGLAVLVTLYLSLVFLVQSGLVPEPVRNCSLVVWNSLLVLWIVGLAKIAGNHSHGGAWGAVVPLGLAVCALATVWPEFFWLTLVYAHPLIGLWILDSEIARSRPAWRKAYHLCLLSIPVLLALIWGHLANSPHLSQSTPVTWQIAQHAGAGLLSGLSSHLLVSTHTFLEMLHYGVWLLAVPLVSAGWQSYRPKSIPLTCRSPFSKGLVSVVLAVSSLAVVALWYAFASNFAVAREFYFTLAIIHVLAEIPFLFRSLV